MKFKLLGMLKMYLFFLFLFCILCRKWIIPENRILMLHNIFCLKKHFHVHFLLNKNRLTCLKSEKYSSSLRKSTSPSSTRQSFYLKLKHSSAVAYTKNDSSSILAFWYIIKTKIKGIKPGVDQEWTNSLTILTMNLKGCAGPDSKPFLQPQST